MPVTLLRSWACGALALGLLTGLGSPAAEAATWAVDAKASTLGFVGTQAGAPFTGRFKTWTAAIDFDPARPEAAHVDVKIDVASATTGDTQRDSALPEADWFNAGTFAEAHFEAKGFVPKGGTAFETKGTLTLRGVSREVTLPFTLTMTGDQAHVVGKTTLVRTDYGVGQGSWSDGSMVALEVAVTIDLTAKPH